jgi:hypothetical protein
VTRSACADIRIVVLLVHLGGPAPLYAAQVEELKVGHEGGVYPITMAFSAEAPVTRVRAALTDCAHLPALSAAIVASEGLPALQDGVSPPS